jgi:predicted GIY-YIG superfamily endonuclease
MDPEAAAATTGPEVFTAPSETVKDDVMRKRHSKRQQTTGTRYHHRVYVVRLAHPRAKGRDAFYVGMTGLPVDERFANHKLGHKSAYVVHKYGVELAPEWYEDIPAMPYEEAVLAEPTLADDLRDLGYLVFGPSNRKRKTKN